MRSSLIKSTFSAHFSDKKGSVVKNCPFLFLVGLISITTLWYPNPISTDIITRIIHPLRNCHASIGFYIVDSGDPLVCQHLTRRVHEIPVSIIINLTGYHSTTGVQIVPTIIDVCPAGYHSTTGVHIVPATIDVCPAGYHIAIGVKPVPVSFDVFP